MQVHVEFMYLALSSKVCEPTERQGVRTSECQHSCTSLPALEKRRAHQNVRTSERQNSQNHETCHPIVNVAHKTVDYFKCLQQISNDFTWFPMISDEFKWFFSCCQLDSSFASPRNKDREISSPALVELVNRIVPAMSADHSLPAWVRVRGSCLYTSTSNGTMHEVVVESVDWDNSMVHVVFSSDPGCFKRVHFAMVGCAAPGSLNKPPLEYDVESPVSPAMLAQARLVSKPGWLWSLR